MKNTRLLALAAIIVFAATAAFAQRCSAPEAASLEKDVAKYKTVTVSVDDCVVTLSGSVNKLSDAWDIENKFRKYPWASRVANYITVIGGPTDDDKVRKDVAWTIAENGYSNLYAPLTIMVYRGQVTLAGGEPNPMILDDMLYSVAGVKGVHSIVSNVTMDAGLNIADSTHWTPRTTFFWPSYVGPIYPQDHPH